MPAGDPTLILECWSDDLSPAQMASYEKAKSEQKVITDKLKELMVNQSGEELFIGEIFSAYQFQGKVQSIDDAYIVKAPPKIKPQHKKPAEMPPLRALKRKAAVAASHVLVDDDDEDVPLAKRASATKKDKDYVAKIHKSPQAPNRSTKQKKEEPVSRDKKLNVSKTPEKPKDKKEKVTTPFRPSEASSIGGLTIGQNKDDGKKPADSKDSAKLQGKTFPSLVVVAKPYLRAKEHGNVDRSALDSKVKVVLMLTPAKFTEWLIQQGLLKSEQKCAIHPSNELKLGVYSDGSKFPYSGGYVWISECCPTRFISVFHGSVFEGAPHPPSCILKLIYHWACQTNIQNVVQWVKVDNLYIKGVYTWLRATCTLALNKHLRLMGGSNKHVEVGVISLGTTAQDGQQRQVKVEVLGILESSEKLIRLRAVEPFSDGDRSYKKRFAKILEPLNDWVSKDSIIVIDLTVDKGTLQSMGYKNVVQAAANDTSAKHTNATIMDYLRRIVPRMFQNTLSLLSRQMIQQFLDELVWREQFGAHALQAFDSITAHLAEQTRVDARDTLTQRLYQVATNPFKNWTHYELNKMPLPSKESLRKASKKSASKDSNRTSDVIAKATKIPSTPPPSASKKEVHKKVESRSPATAERLSIDKNVETRGLEEIYYGVLAEDPDLTYNIEKNENNDSFTCPGCEQSFIANTLLQTNLLSHIDIESNREDYRHQCLFCLEKLPSERGLRRHEAVMHPPITKHSNSMSFNCLICQNRFNNVQLLSAHLQKVHVPLELPYVCYACGHRSSSHHNIIQHFYKNHHNENMLQCPLCLKVVWIFSKDKIMDDNIKHFYHHVNNHFEKANNKKCTKCILTFVTKGELKHHLLKDHTSFNGIKVLSLTDSTVKIPVPKFKNYASKPSTLYKTLEEYPSLIIDLNGGKLCLECDRDFDEGTHISGFHKCQKCEYKTCCFRAILEHTSNCSPTSNNVESGAHIPLEKEMHCVCGFSSSEGNSMARHLVMCEHKSAYPSVEAVQENTVKRNMLDMLGLVRREGEGEESKADDEGKEQEQEDEAQQQEQEQEQEPEPEQEELEQDQDNEQDRMMETDQDQDQDQDQDMIEQQEHEEPQ